MCGEGSAGARGAQVGSSHDGSAGVGQLGGKLPEIHRHGRVGLALEDSVVEVHFADVRLPEKGGPFDHLLLDVLRRLEAGPARLECRTAAAGHGCVSDRVGVADLWVYVLGRNSKHLRKLHCGVGAGAADIDGADGKVHRAVEVYVGRSAGGTGAVGPEAVGDSPASILSFQLALVMVAAPGGFKGLDISDERVHESVCSARALLGPVLNAEFQRVHADFASELVHYLLAGESRARHTGGPVGGGLGLVGNDVVAVYQGVIDVVWSEYAAGRRPYRRAWECARLIHQRRLCGGEPAVVHGAHLDLHVAARSRSGRLEDIGPGHRNLQGTARLLREHRGYRLEVDHRLATEAPADLHRNGLDSGGGDAQHARRSVPYRKVALRAAPDCDSAVRQPPRGRGMRLDIALVDRLRAELALDDNVRLPESLLNVTDAHLVVARNVAFILIVEQRSTRLHGLLDVGIGRQDLILDVYQRQGRFGCMQAVGRDGSNGVPLVEHLTSGHDIAAHVEEVDGRTGVKDLGFVDKLRIVL